MGHGRKPEKKKDRQETIEIEMGHTCRSGDPDRGRGGLALDSRRVKGRASAHPLLIEPYERISRIRLSFGLASLQGTGCVFCVESGLERTQRD